MFNVHKQVYITQQGQCTQTGIMDITVSCANTCSKYANRLNDLDISVVATRGKVGAIAPLTNFEILETLIISL